MLPADLPVRITIDVDGSGGPDMIKRHALVIFTLLTFGLTWSSSDRPRSQPWSRVRTCWSAAHGKTLLRQRSNSRSQPWRSSSLC